MYFKEKVMIVYFKGKNEPWPHSLIETEGDLIILTENNWNDGEYRTTLNARMFFEGDELEFTFHLKMLIENETDTIQFLNNYKKSAWKGFFPLHTRKYISLPSDFHFYQIIKTKLDYDDALELLYTLRDAGLVYDDHFDNRTKKLLQTSSFTSSMLRESGTIKSFEDGWRTIQGMERGIKGFKLNIESRDKKVKTIPFKFKSQVLPYDINVLIGPNGIGKSYCLKSLLEYWLRTGIGDPKKLKQSGHKPFDHFPNFKNIILVSYSPFEDFEIDLEEHALLDKEAYKYFGFRYKRKGKELDIDHNLPATQSGKSLIKAICDGRRYGYIDSQSNKFPTLYEALKNAFEFDHIALEIKEGKQRSKTWKRGITVEGKRYLSLNPISAKELTSRMTEDNFKQILYPEKGVTFIKDNKVINLSSGQRLFAYIVINVVGELSDDSLVVIDEPELFLHPTLEVAFISLLKAILKPFNSKAILATHSPTIVREVPSKCVHIFRDEGYGLDIISPPFETFGGNIQRISSYVFGDKVVTKPYEGFLIQMFENEEHTDESLIKLLGSQINEEMTMAIHRLWRHKPWLQK